MSSITNTNDIQFPYSISGIASVDADEIIVEGKIIDFNDFYSKKNDNTDDILNMGTVNEWASVITVSAPMTRTLNNISREVNF